MRRSRKIDFARDTSAATAVEYALIGGLISVAIVASLPLVADALGPLFETIAAAFSGT